MSESDSGSDVELFGGPRSPEVPDQSTSRRCLKSRDNLTTTRHKKKRVHVRTPLTDSYSDSASDESDTDENNAQNPAPQTENRWLKESLLEIKSLISSLSQKVDRNEKCLREIQNTHTR